MEMGGSVPNWELARTVALVAMRSTGSTLRVTIYNYDAPTYRYDAVTTMAYNMWNNVGSTRVPAAVDVPVVQP